MRVTAEEEGTLTVQGEAAGASNLGVTLSFYFRVTRVRGGQWDSQALQDGR